jgi:TatD DNase family protein
MWIDSHCHLDAAEFAADRDQVAAAAQAAGVRTLVVPAVAVAQFPAMRAVCQRYPGCAPAYGIHPLYVGSAQPADLATLRRWLRDEPAVAVGEIGLDHFDPAADRQLQEWWFVEQLKIAREFELPVLLHVRRAIDPILKQLRRIKVPGGIAHAFNGSRQQADELIKLGFKLGFGGTLTYPGSSRIRALARELPLESIVLETDAPDIPPAFAPRQRNEPAHLPRFGAELAALRGAAEESIAAATTANVRAVLPRLG